MPEEFFTLMCILIDLYDFNVEHSLYSHLNSFFFILLCYLYLKIRKIPNKTKTY